MILCKGKENIRKLLFSIYINGSIVVEEGKKKKKEEGAERIP